MIPSLFPRPPRFPPRASPRTRHPTRAAQGRVRHFSLAILNASAGGLSGIFKSGDYRRGFYERPPYRKGDEKSAYHVRDFDVFKLSQARKRGAEEWGAEGPATRGLPGTAREIRLWNDSGFSIHFPVQVKEHIDVFLSHDWPRGIAMHGDTQRLIRDKPFFKARRVGPSRATPGGRLAPRGYLKWKQRAAVCFLP